MLEIMPNLDYKKNIPIYIQLYEYIKHEIQNGTIMPEEKLPSKRMLSRHLGISMNTVKSAYEQLSDEGYAEGKERKGIFVKRIDDDLSFNPEMEVKQSINTEISKQQEPVIDFSFGKLDLDYFPYSVWRKLTVQALYSDSIDLLSMGEPQGELTLRNAISEYLFQSRGVRCSAEQIIIGAGTQFLLMLLCILIGKEHIYAIENPCFHRARECFKDQGVKVQPISVDEGGICIEELKKSHAQIVYTTPSHQFPYGMIMPISRRMELLKWCEEKNGYIIEDDYDSEFRYKGKPIPSLQGIDNNGRVIYMGTFSKSLFPSIRISYLVLPEKLIRKYNEHCKLYKQTVSRLHQDTLYRFIKEGHWSSHLNKMRTLYRNKHKVLLAAIEKYMGERVEIIGEKAGLHIVLKVKNDMSEGDLIEAAQKMKIKIYPISTYFDEYEESEFSSIILGFGGIKDAQIEEGIKLLKDAWFD